VVAQSSRHIPELDGVRGLAIALVVALHFVYPIAPHNLIERVASRMAGYGLWGVDLFFVLSGFLITGILYDAKGSENYFKNFYMRRTLRIFPLYYGVLLVLLVAIPSSVAASLDPALLETRRLGGWLWPYLSNVYIAKTGAFSIPYVSHFWSLAVEEHFYLFWPFLIGFLSRVNAMRACLFLTALALCLRVSLVLAGATALAPQVLTPCRLDTLCIGAFFALAVRGPSGQSRWENRAGLWLPVSAGVVVLLSAVHKLAPGLDAVVLELRGTALAAFFGWMILSSTAESGFRWLKRGFRIRWLRTLGKYSYGLYVFHGLVAYAFERSGTFHALETRLGSHGMATLTYATAGIGLSLLISLASYELFEVRFLSLKKLFDHRTQPKRVEPVAERSLSPAELAGRGPR
jgi:peptidoglycan/LPS O-acetylase OafA/YrhL